MGLPDRERENSGERKGGVARQTERRMVGQYEDEATDHVPEHR